MQPLACSTHIGILGALLQMCYRRLEKECNFNIAHSRIILCLTKFIKKNQCLGHQISVVYLSFNIFS
jgi:hypothetical protein